MVTVKTIAKLTTLCAVGLLLASCGGPKKGAGDESGSLHPSQLTYTPQDSGVFFRWKPNYSDKQQILGYNFYIAPSDQAGPDFPSSDLAPHNQIPYPGDTQPGHLFETADLHELKNGVTYKGAVRILLPNGALSKPSNVVTFTAMQSGECTLVVRYRGEHDGFNFATAGYTDADDSKNDIYFMTKPEGQFLASPDKLTFGLRRSAFSYVGNYEDVTESFGKTTTESDKTEIRITQGDVLDVTTQDGTVARVYVKDIQGTGVDRIVTLKWYYNPRVDSRQF